MSPFLRAAEARSLAAHEERITSSRGRELYGSEREEIISVMRSDCATAAKRAEKDARIQAIADDVEMPRREAIRELRREGLDRRRIASILGLHDKQVRRSERRP